jgi:glycosyltransferase involved in cell wall biosynthesis
MACGCPVLTSTTPALGEVVGDAARTVDPLDVDAIAEGIRCLVEDGELRETLRARGLRRAKEFSWDRTAAETLAVLEAV